ncbi:hypothetical protein [Diaphorobacter sp.]|nr:hypothetical protein [Diaphorobacter sp.]
MKRRNCQHVRLDAQLEPSSAHWALSHHTEDHFEAINAILDKRLAQFIGR